jgi:hypothetical protein
VKEGVLGAELADGEGRVSFDLYQGRRRLDGNENRLDIEDDYVSHDDFFFDVCNSRGDGLLPGIKDLEPRPFVFDGDVDIRESDVLNFPLLLIERLSI